MARENFERALALVLKHEGGYVDHPADPGGATNRGVTRATLAAWRGRPVSKAEVRALTRLEASAIYRKNYWDAVRADELPAGSTSSSSTRRSIPVRPRRPLAAGDARPAAGRTRRPRDGGGGAGSPRAREHPRLSGPAAGLPAAPAHLADLRARLGAPRPRDRSDGARFRWTARHRPCASARHHSKQGETQHDR